jgi:hypothetical protein
MNMRTACAAALLLAFLATDVFAASPARYWSRSFGAASDDATNYIATFSNSTDFVAMGTFGGTINFDGTPLTAINPTDFWIARFTSTGAVRWARTYKGAPGGLCTDAAGFVYFAGYFSGSTNVGGGAGYSSNGGVDGFLWKLTSTGDNAWGVHFGGPGNEFPWSITLDASNNVIMTGYFNGQCSFGGTGITSVVGSDDGFIVKYNTTGTFAWQTPAQGSNADYCTGAASDAAGNIYATGYTSSNSIFFRNNGMTGITTIDAWVVKLGPTGGDVWSHLIGGSGSDYSAAIASDASGTTVTAGDFSSASITFGSTTLVNAGFQDVYLASYNTSGTAQWASRFGGTNNDFMKCMARDAAGNLYITGACGPNPDFGGGVLPFFDQSDVFLAKYTFGGAHIWSRTINGYGIQEGFAVAPDATGNAIVGGRFDLGIDFGGATTSSAGGKDGFLAKYGPSDFAITGIKDIGNDQGRNVRISFARCPLDDGTAATPVLEYEAFRRVLPLPNVIAKGAQATPSGTWEFVGSIPATNATTYRIVAPTLADSSIALGMYRTKFYVRAATANPAIFYETPADSGYSLDNLAPGVPASFVYSAGNLTWAKSNAADFDYFSIYGSSTSSFAAATLIDYTVNPALAVCSSPYAYYFVTATDFSGNEGKPAMVHSASGVGETPGSYTLSVSAYPNPFNPLTTIRYTLPEKQHVRVAIYNLTGERVATLLDRTDEAGAHTVVWRGHGDNGALASSGVYFARISTPSGDRSYKLVLLK